MQYYQQISRFALNGDAIDVTEDNEHLGIIVSGEAEEQKDVDIILQLCRASMFTLLTGPRCHLKHKFISGSSTVSQSYAITENMDHGNISNLFDVYLSVIANDCCLYNVLLPNQYSQGGPVINHPQPTEITTSINTAVSSLTQDLGYALVLWKPKEYRGQLNSKCIAWEAV